MSFKFKKESVEEITLDLIKSAVHEVMWVGLTDYAPMGASGDTMYLLKKEPGQVSRDRQLSIRLHNSQIELLLTNYLGEFIYYGKYYTALGAEFISQEFYQTFLKLKQHLVLDKGVPRVKSN